MTIPFPQAFEERMHARLQGEWEKFKEAHQAEPSLAIRFNPAKAKNNNTTISENAVPWTAYGKYLSKRPVFTLDPLLHAGTYYIQEASSMFLEQAIKQTIDLTQPIRALDLCAAPGGKSTHILSLISNDSLLVSNEVIRTRASILSENIQKWGNNNIVVTNNDPEDFSAITSFFDLIVVDAPCSGEGLFRKDADAMKEWSEDNVALCSQRQQRIVSDVWPSLKQNGILVYCTCTYNEKENEDNLNWLSQQKNIEFIKLKTDNSWGIEEINKGAATGYRFYPHRLQGEGFFLSVIRKKDEEDDVFVRSKNFFSGPSRKVKEQLNEWITSSANAEYIILDDLVIAVPQQHLFDINFLNKALKVIQKGTALATVKHEKLIPEHALALSNILQQDHFIATPLTLDQALTYLRKDTLIVAEGQRGFSLVTYEDMPLGWVNLLGNRVNNLYPANWRIRMS